MSWEAAQAGGAGDAQIQRVIQFPLFPIAQNEWHEDAAKITV